MVKKICILLISSLLLILNWNELASIRSTTAALQWYNISQAIERGALCNDFSTAGYFIRKSKTDPQQGKKWVIFLEGGGACSTPESCNERFIDQKIRQKYTYKRANGSTHVDVTGAWRDYFDQPLKVTSKLMTTLWRFSRQGMGESLGNWTIKGADILSTSPAINPDFYLYNHVLIPYCSSDLWLRRAKNYVVAEEPSFQFQFDPTLTLKHQFTFRGVAIFRSVVQDLFEYHGLSKADSVLFTGSSAGGIGVMNHAKWFREQLDTSASPHCSLLALLDSSWLIDFKGSTEAIFSADEFQAVAASGEILEPCATAGRQSLSSCFSAASIIPNSDMYPNIPTLVVFSLYDIYLLGGYARDSSDNVDALEILRVAYEYGGSMNTSLLLAKERYSNLSFYVTSCLQHVYLATSSLWGPEDSLFGNAAVDGVQKNNRFR